MIEGVPLIGIVQPKATDGLGGKIQDELAGGILLGIHPSSFEDYQYIPFLDGLAFFALDLGDHAIVLGLDRHFHLHGLEDRDGVSVLDRRRRPRLRSSRPFP